VWPSERQKALLGMLTPKCNFRGLGADLALKSLGMTGPDFSNFGNKKGPIFSGLSHISIYT
tara:strand:+ start:234 stop:416 length:183 start_codon:yes stop_codon:yes gene_type:complete